MTPVETIFLAFALVLAAAGVAAWRLKWDDPPPLPKPDPLAPGSEKWLRELEDLRLEDHHKYC
jgi:hypothetical protein